MNRLDRTRLAELPTHVGVPRFIPAEIGIVHLGLGAFHRAHQAIYTDEALAAVPGPWGISGVSLRSAGVRDRLREQDCLYTAIEKSESGIRRRIIGSLREALFLRDDRAAILERMAAASTAIVTLTITEKGYCRDAATGGLDRSHPDIVHDLADPDAPISATGLICAAMDRRRRSHGTPLTLISCDNLPSNGVALHDVVVAHAQEIDASLARWIDASCAFPSTMVDRIVPATTDADIDDNDADVGLHDAAPVVFEPYRQWVIEDRFAGPRPHWEVGGGNEGHELTVDRSGTVEGGGTVEAGGAVERVGAQFVDDVAAYELLKLRMLNGSHSAMAYLGYLAGHSFIHEVSRDPRFERFIDGLWDESASTLEPLPGIDVADYRRQLWKRFGNSALPHRTWQIAMDGSQKLPQRLLNPIRARLDAGASIDHLALAVAGWMRYVGGIGDDGRVIDVRDPLAATFAAIAGDTRSDPDARVRRLLQLKPIFGDDLPADTRFVDAVSARHRELASDGVNRVMQRRVL